MFSFLYFFFFNATATTEIYTLSLHDALPISVRLARVRSRTGYLQLESECSKRRSHSGRTGSDRGLVCYANQPGPSKVLDKTLQDVYRSELANSEQRGVQLLSRRRTSRLSRFCSARRQAIS